MRITINHIKLSNFKGMSNFETDLFDKTDIYGKNKVGKTTIFDAWLWILFDRDSRGYKGAEACKTTDGAGFVHHLDHEVEVDITVNGTPVKLRKICSEKWTKPRGREEAVYDGNQNFFWIDEVPYQAKQFQAYVNDLMPEATFNVLCDPMYFSTKLPWKERLAMLLDLVGGITDEEVAEGDSDLLDLLNARGEMSMDNYKAMVQDKIKRLNKEIEALPVRINEASRGIDKRADWKEIEKDLAVTTAEYKSAEDALTDAVSFRGLLSKKEQEALELQRQILLKQQLLAEAANDSYKAKKQELNKANFVYDQKMIEIDSVKLSIQTKQGRIKSLEQLNDTLRAEGVEVNKELTEKRKEEFLPLYQTSEFVCPTCSQTMPKEGIEAKKDQLRQNWQREHDLELSKLTRKLESITLEGQANAGAVKALKADLDASNLHLEHLIGIAKAANAEASRLEIELAAFKVKEPSDFDADPEIVLLQGQVDALLKELRKPEDDLLPKLREDRDNLKAGLELIKARLDQKTHSDAAEARVKELQHELKATAQTKEDFSRRIYQIERFIKMRTGMIEDKINLMFTDVSFKLFSEQINGGITETCEPIVNDTIFGKTNHGGQINAGLDIINAFSDHLGISVPVWVDHAESVTQLTLPATQVIILTHKAKVSELTVSEI